jgi:DNA-binding transcriptional ArsR family regulator
LEFQKNAPPRAGIKQKQPGPASHAKFFLKSIAQPYGCAYICSQIAAYMESRRDVFQAIADPTRRAILTLLAVQALTPGAIADHFKSSRQTISRHIQILAECELLQPEQDGREIYYRLNARQMNEVAGFLEPFRKMWDDRFNKLEAVMKTCQSKK